MRVKFKKLLLALMIGAGITMVSCNDDEVVDNGNGKEGPDVSETGYFSFQLKSAPSSKTTIDTEETGTAEEGRVYSIYVVLYDEITGKAEYSWRLDVNNDQTENDQQLDNFFGSDVVNSPQYQSLHSTNVDAEDPTSSRFTTLAQKVIKKPYKMLVVANPDFCEGLVEAIEVGMHKSAFEKVIKTNVEALSGEGELFLMTNARGYVPVKEEDIRPEAREAESRQYAVPVEIDRALAKVLVFIDGAHVINGQIDQSTAKWQLDITNQKTFWMRKQTLMAGGRMMETGAREYPGTDRFDIYAEDPNFFGISNDRPDNSNRPDLSQEFNYTLRDNPSPSLTNSFGHDQWEYALENTMDAQDQWEDVTTRVITKINYIPNPVEGSTPINAGETYYTYNGVGISQTDMNKYESGSNEPPTELQGLKDAIAIIKNNNFNKLDGTSIESWEEEGVTCYVNGFSFYKILIRHFNDNQEGQAMGYGRYGIVRNNIYKINIRRISGPGTIKVPDPDGEDDKESGWISADITIQRWYVRNQEVENL